MTSTGKAGLYDEFTVRTSAHSQMVDITDRVREAVGRSGVREGTCLVFVCHTTAGITINENADPDVQTDMLAALDRLVPWQGPYLHGEGNSAAHLKASLVGASDQVIIRNGDLVLGVWQGLYLAEFDGPRTRRVCVRIMEA